MRSNTGAVSLDPKHDVKALEGMRTLGWRLAVRSCTRLNGSQPTCMA